jgi:CspA family cold shock protein
MIKELLLENEQLKEKSPIKTGTISWYKKDKGFGFIKPDDNSKEVFLYYKELKKINLENIESETKVSFKIKRDKNDRIYACNLIVLEIPSKQDAQRNTAIRVLNILIDRYPKTFGYLPKPLTVGIGKELFTIAKELGLSKRELNIFFKFYCQSKEYKEKLIFNAERINLKGEVAGLVTEQQVIKPKNKNLIEKI